MKWFRLRSSADSAVPSESDSLLVSEDLSEQACLQSDGRRHTSVLTVCLAVTEDLTKYQCVVLCRGKSFSRKTTVQVKGESHCHCIMFPETIQRDHLVVGQVLVTVQQFGPESDI